MLLLYCFITYFLSGILMSSPPPAATILFLLPA